MGSIFSDRISDVPRSFIREILKVAVNPSIISFAGGLPNRNLFPLEGIRRATERVLAENGPDALQYGASEGYHPLREWIAGRYAATGPFVVDPEEILLTHGSQQGLDLLGKTLLNEGDQVAIEKPGYLGAIQAFSIYRSVFNQIPLTTQGPDIAALDSLLRSKDVKLFYTVPNFQNPSGVTYTKENRKEVAALVSKTETILVEDDPYGELRFRGKPAPSFRVLAPHNSVLLGTFSKIVAPAFRVGWIIAREDIREKLLVAKQASDLHTNGLGQRIIHRYLVDNDIDDHILRIREAYGCQRDSMVESIREYFPEDVQFTEPEGGMFLWVRLPSGMSSMKLFDEAIRRDVAFVPGEPFYPDNPEPDTLRLNFSSVDEDTIRTGMKRLSEAITACRSKVTA